jgi:hypothetical protein
MVILVRQRDLDRDPGHAGVTLIVILVTQA